MKNLLLILLCFPLLVFSQEEKRLALVIGNANYDKGELKNPVNDALLISRTLDSLNFDVILDTNISDRSSLINTIREFGDRRENYDVGFVYYAGHGVQVNGENYLLPIKCEDCKNKEYNTENDIIDYAVSVQKIMRFLTSIDNQVNILILDACRDNPFERNWNRTRSLKGEGLAKISPPMGSLIAFSTDVGNTAADGDGENSIYCQSLVQNMLKENTDLNQVFRNVRREVLLLTNNQQSPVEESKLTGDAFYLVISDFKKEFEQIALLEDKEQYYEALEIINKIIFTQPKSIRAYYNRARVYEYLEQYDMAEEDYTKALELGPEYYQAYSNRGSLYRYLSQYEKAESDFTKVIELAPENIDAYNNRAGLYQELEQYDKAEADYTRIIEIDPEEVYFGYCNRASHYKKLEQYDKALADYTNTIETFPAEPAFYSMRAELYSIIKRYEKAESDYTKAIELNPEYYQAYLMRAELYSIIKRYEKAESDYTKAIELNPEYYQAYSKRGNLYQELEQYDKAEADYTKIIEIDPKDVVAYMNRAAVYDDEYYILEMSLKRDSLYDVKVYELYNKIHANYTKVIELDPQNTLAYKKRAWYNLMQKNYDLSLNDYTTAIELNPDEAESYEYRASIYEALGNYDNAEEDYTTSLKLAEDECQKMNNQYGHKKWCSLSSSYISRADFYVEINEYQKALVDYTKAIEIYNEAWGEGEVVSQMAYLSRGDLYVLLEQYEKAEADYMNASTDAWSDGSLIIDAYLALIKRGDLYVLLEQYEKAAQCYTKTIEINAGNQMNKRYSIYKKRLKTYMNLEDFKKAEDDCNAIIKIDPKDPEAYFHLAIIFNFQDKNVAAIDMLSTSIIRLLDGDYIGDNVMGIKSFEGDDIELKGIYIKRGEIYQSMNIDRFMCNDFKKACDLGDCEMFNMHCK